MEKKEALQRSPTNVLSDDELKFFYEKILLFYETDNRTYGEFNNLPKKVLGTFEMEYEDYEQKLNELKEPSSDVFFFSAKTPKGKTTEIGKMWFGHLRNAFAHNYITKDKDGCFVLQDYSPEHKSGKRTLYVKLSSFDDFKSLVDRIQTRIEEKKNNKKENKENETV